MYTFFLSLHNILRWFVVIFAILAIVRAYAGWSGKKEWAKADDRAGIMYTGILDLQVLVGLILYLFLSPITTSAFSNLSAAMTSSPSRFFTLDHILLMVIAMVVAHVGRSLSRKAATVQARFRLAALGFSLSILLILLAIPWPFLATIGRPLLRLGGFTL